MNIDCRLLKSCAAMTAQWGLKCGTARHLHLPIKPHLPLMTPSGLSMGTILKMKVSLSAWAVGWVVRRNRRTPFMMNELLLSPGWTRADRKMYLRFPGKIEMRRPITIGFPNVWSDSVTVGETSTQKVWFTDKMIFSVFWCSCRDRRMCWSKTPCNIEKPS